MAATTPTPQYQGPQTPQNGPFAPGDSNPWLGGMPSAPGFVQIYNPSMAQLPGYEDYLKNNSQGYDAFRSMAMRPGASNWANLASTQQEMQAADQGNKANAQANQAAHQAQDQLSMQGGLTAGARERAVEGSMNDAINANQGIARQAGLNKLQISMNDEQNRISQLGQLPGMESQRQAAWENVSRGDAANKMAEKQAENQYNQNAYNQQMQAWAAGKQAEATANSGKK